ncbi:unnamed protein product [Periconia digitata]|uniref:Uncharacterized protein n=1 Tax=Periconia digitata TaxID=1303443 RepID=A0A9W4US60_9PLEO|nr:unnamed protein product [Periconia digitata]
MTPEEEFFYNVQSIDEPVSRSVDIPHIDQQEGSPNRHADFEDNVPPPEAPIPVPEERVAFIVGRRETDQSDQELSKGTQTDFDANRRHPTRDLPFTVPGEYDLIARKLSYDRFKSMPSKWKSPVTNTYFRERNELFESRWLHLTDEEKAIPANSLTAIQELSNQLRRAEHAIAARDWHEERNAEYIKMLEDRDRQREIKEKKLVQDNINYRREIARMTTLMDNQETLNKRINDLSQVNTALMQSCTMRSDIETLVQKLENGTDLNNVKVMVDEAISLLAQSNALDETIKIGHDFESAVTRLVNFTEDMERIDPKVYLKEKAAKDKDQMNQIMENDLRGFVDSRYGLESYIDRYYDRGVSGFGYNRRHALEQTLYQGWEVCDRLWKECHQEITGKMYVGRLRDFHRGVNLGTRMALNQTILEEDNAYAKKMADAFGVVCRVNLNKNEPFPDQKTPNSISRTTHRTQSAESYDPTVQNSYYGWVWDSICKPSDAMEYPSFPVDDVVPPAGRIADIVNAGKAGRYKEYHGPP